MKTKESKHLEKIHFDELENEIGLKKFNLIVHRNEKDDSIFSIKINRLKTMNHCYIYEYDKYKLDLQYNIYFKEIIKLIDNKVKAISIGTYGNHEYCVIADYADFEKKLDAEKYFENSQLYSCIELVLLLISRKDEFVLISDYYFNGVYYKKYINIFKLILKICNELNIQLIMHSSSNDVLNGFVDALLELDENDSQVIRLDKKEEKIKPVCFYFDELLIAKNNDISIF